jgi:hypothetical protein
MLAVGVVAAGIQRGRGDRRAAVYVYNLAPSMKPLLQTFIDIALWRKGPQDLPASRYLAMMVLAAYVGIGLVQARLFHFNLRATVLILAVDVLMLAGWLWGVLAFFGRRQRFIQTATAVLGVGVLMGVLDILMRGVQIASGASEILPPEWSLLRFIAIALILGRIFMHALDRGLLTGMALTVAIVYSTQEVVQIMLERLAVGG